MAFRWGQELGQMDESSKDTSAVVEYHMLLTMACRAIPACPAMCQAFFQALLDSVFVGDTEGSTSTFR